MIKRGWEILHPRLRCPRCGSCLMLGNVFAGKGEWHCSQLSHETNLTEWLTHYEESQCFEVGEHLTDLLRIKADLTKRPIRHGKLVSLKELREAEVKP